VLLEFNAPDQKQFEGKECTGSKGVCKHVFEPLLRAEMANASATARTQSEISHRNYSFEFDGFDAESNSYVFSAAPRTINKYLFRGKIWIDADDFAIRRIDGQPAQNPSFWVKSSHFVHEYRKLGDFWLPMSTRSESELRLFGHSELTIEYFDYECNTSTALSKMPLEQR
jgi:hypothetical protein